VTATGPVGRAFHDGFEPLRLLAIAPTAFFADYGCHVRIRGQLQALQRRGYTVRLLTYPAGRDVPDLPVLRPPLPFIRQLPVGSSRRKLMLDALLLPMAVAAALRFRPQLVHGYLHEGAFIGWWVARLLGVPLSFDYQGSLTGEMLDHGFLSPHSPLLPFWQRLEAWIDRRPQAVFPSSGHAATTLARGGLPAERLHPLPDSVEPGLFAPQPADPALRRHLGLAPDRPVVVYLGLLAPYQGTDLLLHSIATPPLAAHPARFLIMGFPAEAAYRRRAERLGIGDRVVFTGPIPYSQAPRYLALGDLAVAPKLSHSEGSGKLLPYMSMGLPIVATDTPVHREYLGDDGILVPPEPQALATAIVHALDRRAELAAMGARLRARVQACYTWDHAAAMMDAVFRRLLA
jgi:glycosyltransferase involved in cell wall biosynthesis